MGLFPHPRRWFSTAGLQWIGLLAKVVDCVIWFKARLTPLCCGLKTAPLGAVHFSRALGLRLISVCLAMGLGW